MGRSYRYRTTTGGGWRGPPNKPNHNRLHLPPKLQTSTHPKKQQNQQASTGRALDLGCAVGGSTFALARGYGEVHGLELSEAFVDAAKALQVREKL